MFCQISNNFLSLYCKNFLAKFSLYLDLGNCHGWMYSSGEMFTHKSLILKYISTALLKKLPVLFLFLQQYTHDLQEH